MEYFIDRTPDAESTPPPARCGICGYYLTDDARYRGFRCVDPAHWQAAGRPHAHNRLLDLPGVGDAVADAARRDLASPQSHLRALLDWNRRHCERCGHAVDTYTVDTCPRCGHDFTPPF